ncbi:glycosyltransferase family 2 protein [Henriciella sp.]|uniref:glycosyltransferase family 2 protein n=1 Tax=Henriciella sp. TaxID=1968823 RepID=UPI002624F37E|nr:glycosyltransferase family A protein [Henriciella sp.]
MSEQPGPGQDKASDTALLEAGHTAHGETVLSNSVSSEVKLSICVPCYHDSADPLMAALRCQEDAGRTALLLFDDGSGDAALTRQLASHVAAWPGPARLVTASDNKGRAHARNRLVDLAEAVWILLIDADMRPDDDGFLARYAEAAAAAHGPALIAGGFTLQHATPTRETALHAAQSRRSECLPASTRATAPGRYVFTSNILVHRAIMETVGFDDGFQGWGWEDVDWGLRVAARYEVRHIDNTATHLGLDTTEALLAKFGGSGANFARLAERHPAAVRDMRLWTMTQRLKRLPLRGAWIWLTRQSARQTWLPMRLRLLALKCFRAFSYGGKLA